MMPTEGKGGRERYVVLLAEFAEFPQTMGGLFKKHATFFVSVHDELRNESLFGLIRNGRSGGFPPEDTVKCCIRDVATGE